MYFQFIAKRRDFETLITDLTLLSVMAAGMWRYLTLILVRQSLTVPLSKFFCTLSTPDHMLSAQFSSGSTSFLPYM